MTDDQKQINEDVRLIDANALIKNLKSMYGIENDNGQNFDSWQNIILKRLLLEIESEPSISVGIVHKGYY